jgi:NAD(P)-dependent dehydrogenase (short-subunit alcohol dehydrogenase family)
MARVFITGSSDGLGLMAARLLIEEGHSVIGHARSEHRAEQTRTALPGAEQVVTGDLSSMEQTRGVAGQVNALGDVDAVIYNAGVGPYERQRVETADGLAHVFEIDVLAPYILTALIARPRRLVYLTSGMHRGGVPALDDPQWEHRAWRGSQAYSDAKLYDLALAMAVGRSAKATSFTSSRSSPIPRPDPPRSRTR